jgi:hypothetical protein
MPDQAMTTFSARSSAPTVTRVAEWIALPARAAWRISAVGGVAVADRQQRVRLAHLLGERRAHRPARHQMAVADAAAAVDDQQRIVEGELRALEAVVHDDEVGALLHQFPGALDAPARDHRQRLAGEQQRLVADGAGAVVVRIDDGGDVQRAAIAARQEAGLQAAGLRRAGERDRRRRLAGAAHGEIADADDGHRNFRAAALAHAPAGDEPIEARDRPERISAPVRLRPPERRRFTYHSFPHGRPDPVASKKREKRRKINHAKRTGRFSHAAGRAVAASGKSGTSSVMSLRQ